MARGGPRYEEVTIKLDKKLFKLLNAICGGDQRKMDRLIRKLLMESIKGRQMEELIELAETPIKRRRKKEETLEEPSVE